MRCEFEAHSVPHSHTGDNLQLLLSFYLGFKSEGSAVHQRHADHFTWVSSTEEDGQGWCLPLLQGLPVWHFVTCVGYDIRAVSLWWLIGMHLLRVQPPWLQTTGDSPTLVRHVLLPASQDECSHLGCRDWRLHSIYTEVSALPSASLTNILVLC